MILIEEMFLQRQKNSENLTSNMSLRFLQLNLLQYKIFFFFNHLYARAHKETSSYFDYQDSIPITH